MSKKDKLDEWVAVGEAFSGKKKESREQVLIELYRSLNLKLKIPHELEEDTVKLDYVNSCKVKQKLKEFEEWARRDQDKKRKEEIMDKFIELKFDFHINFALRTILDEVFEKEAGDLK